MLSREYLIDRGYCCGLGCRMCPYKPKHTKGNTKLMEHIKIHEYDKVKFNFKMFFEERLKFSLENFHDHYEFEYEDDAKHHTDNPIYDKLYSWIRSDEFGEIWKGFIEECVKPALKSDDIVLQKLPSIRVHSPTYKGNFKDRDNNFHTDGGKYWHPPFETNFWLPLTTLDKWNTLHVDEGENVIKPQLMEVGEFLQFDGQSKVHGTINENKSKTTRVSLDFRGCALEDYDDEELTEEIMTSKKVPVRQKDWFSIGNYYERF
tara:strand:+ start:2197 stop:2979 length:783 start_codon:yes stop_codon:yes gene_type:complete